MLYRRVVSWASEAHSRDNQILLTEVVDVVLLQSAGPGQEQRDILHFMKKNSGEGLEIFCLFSDVGLVLSQVLSSSVSQERGETQQLLLLTSDLLVQTAERAWRLSTISSSLINTVSAVHSLLIVNIMKLLISVRHICAISPLI